MCHSKLGKQKWPFRSRLGDASCSEHHALFLVSPVSPSQEWSIRKARNWQEKKQTNPTAQHHSINFTLSDLQFGDPATRHSSYFLFFSVCVCLTSGEVAMLRDVALTCIFPPVCPALLTSVVSCLTCPTFLLPAIRVSVCRKCVTMTTP